MKKTAVIAVSTGCLDYLDITHDNLYIVRCKIVLRDDTYDDYTQIKADHFYDAIRKDSSLVPTSSMPAIGEINDTLEAVEKQGYEDVLVITISSQLSGTYQTVQMAANAYEGDLKIYPLDTKNAAISEGFISLEALRLIEADTPTEEIVAYLETLSLARKQYFMVDNLRLLVKNGRLSGAKGFMGRLLKMKPILEVNDEGKIVPFEKVRTQSKALTRMVEVVLEQLKNVEEFVITYDTSDNTEGFEYVFNRIEEVYPNHRYYAAPITPVIGAHTGVGTVGIAFFDLKKARGEK